MWGSVICWRLGWVHALFMIFVFCTIIGELVSKSIWMKKYIGMQHIESIRYIDLHSNAKCVIVTLLTYCTLFQQIFDNWDLTHIPFSFDTCPQLTIWKQLLFSWQECIWYSCLNCTYNSVVSVDGVPLVWVVSTVIKVCVINFFFGSIIPNRFVCTQ